MKRAHSRFTRTLLLAAGLFGAAAAPAAAQTGTAASPAVDATPLEAAAATITAERVYGHAAFLASDEMRGRDTPSPELEKAAAYIADHFASLGLEPAGDDGGYLQRWPYRLQQVDADAVRLEIAGAERTERLRYARDFFVLPGSPAAPAEGTPVFLGPAADAAGAIGPELEGRIAVLSLAGLPGGPWQAALARALTALGEAGAAAAVFVLDPEFSAEYVAALSRDVGRPQRDQTLGLEPRPAAAFVRHAAAGAIFRAAGRELAPLWDRGAAEPLELDGATVRMAVSLRILSNDNPPNVVAVLRGSDPELRDEYVVFSAHMDHVGVGRPDASGDSIYNGADDNASGTSALLEVARAFAALADAPDRSIVFLAVSGEEKGLLGSRYFSERPTVPMENVVTNINMDMVGRNDPDMVVAIGLEWSSLGPLVQGVAEARHEELGLSVSPDLWPEERLFFRSDQYHFVRKEIPALFLFSGLHEDYHRPSDTVDKLDTEKVARVARLAFYTAHEIASRPERPEWTPDGLAEVRELTAGGRR